MPNGLNIIEKVKLLTVKIELKLDDKGYVGTGIIIQSDEEYYVLTVEHVIFGHENELSPKVEDLTIYLHDDRLIRPIQIKQYNNLVLIKVDGIDFNLPDVQYLEKALYDVNYHLRGYPKALRGGESFPFNEVKCSDINADRQTFMMTIQNMNGDSSGDDTINKIRGLSGSGVFFEELGKLYLVGIVNNLIDKYGIFNSVKAYTLVDLLNGNEVALSSYKSINQLFDEMKRKTKIISAVEFEEFQQNPNENFSNLDRKNNTIYEHEEVQNKNFIRVSEYVNGNVVVNDLTDIDTDFRNKWMDILSDVLQKFDSQYGLYIADKMIGQDRIIRMHEVVKEAIWAECGYLDQHIADKLASHAIAKWLLDCNVNFIVRNGNGI